MGGITSSFGDGYILLDNYDSSAAPPITYGAGVPLNGVSGADGQVGSWLISGWTAGIYFVVGTPTKTDPAGSGIPNLNLTLGTGPGGTTAICSSAYNVPGFFINSLPFDTGGIAGDTITAEIVAYSGSSYATSLYRGHSNPFTMTTYSSSSVCVENIVTGYPNGLVGDHMQSFSVTPTPEPGTLALVVLSSIALFSTLRRKPS